MTITTYNDLFAHFMRIYESGGEGKKSPFFTLFAGGIGEKDKILLWNDQIDNPEEAFQLLSKTIKQLNNPSGQSFRVFQTYKPRHNFASGEYRVQIFENAIAPSGVQPGIAGLPGISSIADIERIVQEKQEKWELQRQVEDLQSQLNAPNTFFDKATDFIERIGATPLGQLIAARLLGGGMPSFPAQPITGHPQPHQPPMEEGELNEQEERFWDNIGAASTALNLTPDQLAEKLRKLLENPLILETIKTQLQP